MHVYIHCASIKSEAMRALQCYDFKNSFAKKEEEFFFTENWSKPLIIVTITMAPDFYWCGPF
jgi:hypothetical protein